MALPRTTLRPIRQLTTKLRSPPFQLQLQLRSASTADSAPSTSSTPTSDLNYIPPDLQPTGRDNAFNRKRKAQEEHAPASADLWRKISCYVAAPAILLAGANAWVLWQEHWEHFAHMPPLEERVEYQYQNVRTKNFFWGDGDKTLFWNDKVNYHKKD